ncbi:MAG: DUF4398 domain-containing protein [Burkholderiales bacterium]
MRNETTRFALLAAAMALGVRAHDVQAEPATARYAPTQLEAARDELSRASAAARRGESARAAWLASQAVLDARIAWAMSESAALRRQASEIVLASDRLVRSLSLEQAAAGR